MISAFFDCHRKGLCKDSVWSMLHTLSCALAPMVSCLNEMSHVPPTSNIEDDSTPVDLRHLRLWSVGPYTHSSAPPPPPPPPRSPTATLARALSSHTLTDKGHVAQAPFCEEGKSYNNILRYQKIRLTQAPKGWSNIIYILFLQG